MYGCSINMPLFSYRAINDDNQEVRGTIEAPDLVSAKESVEKMHMEVKEVQEASRKHNLDVTSGVTPPVPVFKTQFAYEATDEKGETRRGTIEADNKRSAFDKLKSENRFYVTSLSPSGITPPYRDYDLVNWQKNEIKPLLPLPDKIPNITEQPEVRLKFASQTNTKSFFAGKPDTDKPEIPEEREYNYFPMIVTLRLYAGWLLAWYGLFVALGYYSFFRSLPFEIPFVEAFFLSPLIFTFVLAIFLFLFFSTLNRAWHGNRITGLILALAGVGLVIFVRTNI